MHDVDTIRAFLDDAHVGFAEDVDAFARAELRPRAETADDAAARVEAREILELLGDGGWLAPIAGRELRRIALAREAIAAASPLADAVYALQALGATPILLAGDRAGEVKRWVDEAVAGRAMGAFAMTEGRGGGEFYTPSSIVRLLVEVIEPFHGRILDPACGSGGMFVQSARFVSEHRKNPGAELAIHGQEKEGETVNLCRLNLSSVRCCSSRPLRRSSPNGSRAFPVLSPPPLPGLITSEIPAHTWSN